MATDTCHAKTAEGTRCPDSATRDLILTCPDGTDRTALMCEQHAEVAMTRGLWCDMHGDHISHASVCVEVAA